MLDARCATASVPYINDLNLVAATNVAENAASVPQRRVRLRGKQESNAPTVLRSFDMAWRAYIRGKVVSRHAKQQIIQFMAACCGKTRRVDDTTDETTRPTRVCPPNELQLERLHTIMDELGEAASAQEQSSRTTATASRKDNKEVDTDDDDAGGARRSEQMQNALHTTAQLWQRDTSPWMVSDLDPNNLAHTRLASSARVGLKQSKKHKGKRPIKPDPKSVQSGAYVKLQRQDIDAW